MRLYRILVNTKNAAPKAAQENDKSSPAAVLIAKPSATDAADIKANRMANCLNSLLRSIISSQSVSRAPDRQYNLRVCRIVFYFLTQTFDIHRQGIVIDEFACRIP